VSAKNEKRLRRESGETINLRRDQRVFVRTLARVIVNGEIAAWHKRRRQRRIFAAVALTTIGGLMVAALLGAFS
jgi:predicted alpha/beta hydrolase